MTRLQAAIGGLVFPTVIILSIGFLAPEVLSRPPSAPAQAVAEPNPDVTPALLEESAGDRTLVKPTIFKKVQEQAPVVAQPEALAVVASPASAGPAAGPSTCERYLYPVVMPKDDGLIDRLVDNKAEQALAAQQKRNARAIGCYRAERSKGR